jgi:hypothetical protein
MRSTSISDVIRQSALITIFEAIHTIKVHFKMYLGYECIKVTHGTMMAVPLLHPKSIHIECVPNDVRPSLII